MAALLVTLPQIRQWREHSAGSPAFPTLKSLDAAPAQYDGRRSACSVMDPSQWTLWKLGMNLVTTRCMLQALGNVHSTLLREG